MIINSTMTSNYNMVSPANLQTSTDLQFAQEALRVSEEKYRTILEDIDEGYFETDLNGNFTFFNDVLCRDLDYTRQELIGMNYRQYMDHPMAQLSFEIFSDIFRTGKASRRYEGEFIGRNGRKHFCEVSVSLLRDTQGKPIGFRGLSRNISERKKMERERQDSIDKLRKSLGATINAMSAVVEARDPYTAGHQRRVSDLARAIATEMGLTRDSIDGIRLAGMIHDLGKISIPSEILTKPTRLSDLEMKLIQTHPEAGYNILKDIDFPWPIARIVLEHHERIDGSGYPQGLTDKNILQESKIISVADVVEAISSHRPYRPAFGIGPALDEITRNSGILYDEKAAEACLKLFRENRYRMPD